MCFHDKAIKYYHRAYDVFVTVGEFVRANASNCADFAWSWH